MSNTPFDLGILTGGSSTRMGEPKATLVLPDGRTMLETVRDNLAPLATTVFILGGSFVLKGCESINDSRPGDGPLAGIEALLQVTKSAHVLVVPCDMPFFDAKAANTLLALPDAPVTHFLEQPLPCRISSIVETRAAVASLLDNGNRAVKALHAHMNAFAAACPQPAWLRDFDTQASLRSDFTNLTPAPEQT